MQIIYKQLTLPAHFMHTSKAGMIITRRERTPPRTPPTIEPTPAKTSTEYVKSFSTPSNKVGMLRMAKIQVHIYYDSFSSSHELKSV